MKSVFFGREKKKKKTPLELNATRTTAHTLEDTSLGVETSFTTSSDTLTVTNRATDTDIRYVTGLLVYTVRIYSTKAILFKSMTTLVTLV